MRPTQIIPKCLWKVSKTAKESLEDRTLDARRLLFDIDRFLQAIPPAEWRRRASDDIPLGDMPLRTVKTILQQIVATFGESVYEELVLIDKPENSFVYQYLFRLLNNSRSMSIPAASDKLSRQSSTISQDDGVIKSKLVDDAMHQITKNGNGELSARGGMSPGRSNDIEMNQALKEIFDKIGNTQESKNGIAELYEFQKLHPE